MSDLTPRHSVRVLLFNGKDELLLLRADDPSTTTIDGTYQGHFWFPVGGAIEEGETIEQTARREVFEETGITDFHLGPIIWFGTVDLVLSGVPTRLFQQFIVAHTNEMNITLDHLTEEEKRVLTHARWFSVGEIETSDEIIYPSLLRDHLRPIAQGFYPSKPLEVHLS